MSALSSSLLLLLALLLHLSTPLPLEYQDDQEYNYDLYNGQEGDQEDSEEKLEITRQPVIQSAKEHVMVEVDTLIRLPCLVDNPDNIQIIWSHIAQTGKAQIAIGATVIAEATGGRATVKVDKQGSTLFIPQAKASDSGEYTCEVAVESDRPTLVHVVTVRDTSIASPGEEREAASVVSGAHYSSSLVSLTIGMAMVLLTH